jgi:hypothetical protein
MSVSELVLGTMMFGAMGNSDHSESVRMIHTALDAGINFIDTADVYSRGESEEIVGQALRGPDRAGHVRPGRPGQPGPAHGRAAPHRAGRPGRRSGPAAHSSGDGVRPLAPGGHFCPDRPRQSEQLADLLASADVELTGDVLDQIDEIVPPGTEINPADNYLAAHPAVNDQSLRRRVR